MAEPRYTGRPPQFIGGNVRRETPPEFRQIQTPTESGSADRGSIDYDRFFGSFQRTTSSISGLLGSIVPQSEKDHRVRLKAKPGQESNVYGNGPMSIFHKTNGLVFPYTPQIQYDQSITYSKIGLVHTNQDFNYYGSTSNPNITFSGRFTAQNKSQAAYCFAAIHFIKTVTKMRFGINDGKRGLPPPVLILEGYGTYMFNDLPVILLTSSITLPDAVDYVQVPLSRGDAWVPTDFTISFSLTVQNTPSQWRDAFNWDAFRDGRMMGAGTKGWT